MEFDWDDANEGHLARHGITRRDAEAALTDPFAEIIDSDLIGGELRFRQIGSTEDGKTVIAALRCATKLFDRLQDLPRAATWRKNIEAVASSSGWAVRQREEA